MALSSEQMYDVVGELFDAFMDDPKMVSTARKTNIIMQYNFFDPTVKITIDGTVDPPTITYGDTDLKPAVTISMQGKVAHQFMMGKANAADLFMKKKIKVAPVSQAMKYIKLVPMFLGLLKRYPEVLKEKGLEEEGRQWLSEA
ncbi:MAG: hypothetical protein C4536_11090 [Actinobacteria bacterium]|jgi:hypothetical protein|nr:MAG: hypothetical protein C4536_11090 [Actinomycetota bacterium]